MACLMGERCGRQLFSHVRGGLMNGCTRPMCERVMRDAEAVYREAGRRDGEAGYAWVEEALELVRKVDRKVNPSDYSDGGASPPPSPGARSSDGEVSDGEGGGGGQRHRGVVGPGGPRDGGGGGGEERGGLEERSKAPPVLRRSQSLPSSAKL